LLYSSDHGRSSFQFSAIEYLLVAYTTFDYIYPYPLELSHPTRRRSRILTVPTVPTVLLKAGPVKGTNGTAGTAGGLWGGISRGNQRDRRWCYWYLLESPQEPPSAF